MDRDKPRDQFVISVSFCAFKHQQIHLSPNKCAIFGQIWSVSIYIHFDWSIRILFCSLYLHGDAYSQICQNFWASFCLDLSFPELRSCWVSSILNSTYDANDVNNLAWKNQREQRDEMFFSVIIFPSLLRSRNDRDCAGLGSSGKGEGSQCEECLSSWGQPVLSFVVLPVDAGGSGRLLGMTSKPLKFISILT